MGWVKQLDGETQRFDSPTKAFDFAEWLWENDRPDFEPIEDPYTRSAGLVAKKDGCEVRILCKLGYTFCNIESRKYDPFTRLWFSKESRANLAHWLSHKSTHDGEE